ncbi:Gfo/Idh/MocA family oxidoreductase [soil metagenome]
MTSQTMKTPNEAIVSAGEEERAARPLSTSRKARRFAYVGTGGRIKMFLDPVPESYLEDAEIVGLCDLSLVRATFQAERLRQKFGYARVPVYAAEDFLRMLKETEADVVVVCTTDRTHDEYIVEALLAGCDVVSEKPMTIDATRCQRILDAVEKTGRSVRVAFNYRWAPGPTKVRELLAAGTIGTVRHVNMEYLLNTSHGADYFRRWHSDKASSGGLLVHKSTHHFDLINWWIDAIPERVFAQGGLFFYGRENALKRGDEALTRYARYHGTATDGDPFAYDYSTSLLQDQEYEKALYLGSAEKETGYVRDQNVFREGINIEDVMNVMVRYRTGTLLNYSLNAFSPYEGYRVTFTGDRGRIEYKEWHGAHILGADTTGSEHTEAGQNELEVFPHFHENYKVKIPHQEGGHGGGDPLLQEQVFSLSAPRDQWGRAAGHEQGAASIMVGVAANASMASNRPVMIADMVTLNPEARHLSELI